MASIAMMTQRPQRAAAGKYARLFHHLDALGARHWRAAFSEVEAVLGFKLPPSARAYPAWWANQADGGHSHALAWLAAGWRTGQVDLAAGTLLFERAEHPAEPWARRRRRAEAPAGRPRPGVGGRGVRAVAGTLTLGGRAFRHMAPIEPDTGPDGKPLEDVPRHRYRHAASTPLHRHGTGPFCRFDVPSLPATPGVYAVTVGGELVYVGITVDLRQRWGPTGYAQIQPRNCFKGGQSTNCKVNHAILLATRNGRAVELWMHETRDRHALEERLIRELAPRWNHRS